VVVRRDIPELVALGLRRGDVMLDGGGRPLRGADAVEQLLRDVFHETSLPLQVLRGESKLSLTLALSGPPLRPGEWWSLTPDDADWRASRGISVEAVAYRVPRESLFVGTREDGVAIPDLGVWLAAPRGYALRLRDHDVAASLGLHAHDVLLTVDGEPVSDLSDVVAFEQSLVSARAVQLLVVTVQGERVLTWTLSGPPVDVVLTTADVRTQGTSARRWLPAGARPDAVTAELEALHASAARGGVRLTQLKPRGRLAALGLVDGDVVVSVGGAAVGTGADVGARLVAALTAGVPFEVRVRRRGSDWTLSLAPPEVEASAHE